MKTLSKTTLLTISLLMVPVLTQAGDVPPIPMVEEETGPVEQLMAPKWMELNEPVKPVMKQMMKQVKELEVVKPVIKPVMERLIKEQVAEFTKVDKSILDAVDMIAKLAKLRDDFRDGIKNALKVAPELWNLWETRGEALVRELGNELQKHAIALGALMWAVAQDKDQFVKRFEEFKTHVLAIKDGIMKHRSELQDIARTLNKSEALKALLAKYLSHVGVTPEFVEKLSKKLGEYIENWDNISKFLLDLAEKHVKMELAGK